MKPKKDRQIIPDSINNIQEDYSYRQIKLSLIFR